MNKVSIIICLFSCLLISCRSQRQLIQTTRTDSVCIEVKPVEVPVIIPGDTAKIQFQAVRTSGDSAAYLPQTQMIETERTSVKVVLDAKGKITATAISKPVNKTVTVMQKTVTKSSIKEAIIEREKKKGFFESFKNWLVWLLVLAIIAAIIRFFKPVSNLFKSILK